MDSERYSTDHAPTTYKLRSGNRRYGVSLHPSHLARIVELCQRANRVETGGVLVGHYSSDQELAIVTGVSDPPSDSKHSRTRFLRGVHGLQGWLNRLWSQNRYYLGEWHYHPCAAPDPSPCDSNQMRDIAFSKSYNTPEPLLLILGGVPHEKWSVRAFVFVSDKGLVELLPDCQ